MQTHSIPFGTSEPQDFALRNNGQPYDGTGSTVELEIKQYVSGVAVAVPSPPSVAWLAISSGTVRVTGVGSLPVGSYLVRYKLTDAGGKVGYFPNGPKADVWAVVAVASW